MEISEISSLKIFKKRSVINGFGMPLPTTVELSKPSYTPQHNELSRILYWS